jgi:hypothetical protein
MSTRAKQQPAVLQGRLCCWAGMSYRLLSSHAHVLSYQGRQFCCTLESASRSWWKSAPAFFHRSAPVPPSNAKYLNVRDTSMRTGSMSFGPWRWSFGFAASLAPAMRGFYLKVAPELNSLFKVLRLCVPAHLADIASAQASNTQHTSVPAQSLRLLGLQLLLQRVVLIRVDSDRVAAHHLAVHDRAADDNQAAVLVFDLVVRDVHRDLHRHADEQRYGN